MKRLIHIVDAEERFKIRVPETDAVFICRRLPEEKAAEIQAQHRPPKNATAQEIEDCARAAAEAEFDYLLVGWEGVAHPISGEEVPCTPENKKRLPKLVKSFIITRLARALAAEDDPAEEETAIENLSDTSASAPPTRH